MHHYYHLSNYNVLDIQLSGRPTWGERKQINILPNCLVTGKLKRDLIAGTWIENGWVHSYLINQRLCKHDDYFIWWSVLSAECTLCQPINHPLIYSNVRFVFDRSFAQSLFFFNAHIYSSFCICPIEFHSDALLVFSSSKCKHYAPNWSMANLDGRKRY